MGAAHSTRFTPTPRPPPPPPPAPPTPFNPEPHNKHAICQDADAAQLAKQDMDLAQVLDTIEHHLHLAQGWGDGIPEGARQAVFFDSCPADDRQLMVVQLLTLGVQQHVLRQL